MNFINTSTTPCGCPKTPLPHFAAARKHRYLHPLLHQVALRHWLGLSDLYAFPNVTLFDSWEHLLQLLQQAPIGRDGPR